MLLFCIEIFSSQSTHIMRVRTTSKGVQTVSEIKAANEPHTQAANPLTEIPEKR